jgi:hypothetical protein
MPKRPLFLHPHFNPMHQFGGKFRVSKIYGRLDRTQGRPQNYAQPNAHSMGPRDSPRWSAPSTRLIALILMKPCSSLR